jgi:general secretion pathway protein B
MSFILDALKKSETDRQEQGSAEFAGIPTRPQSPSVPRWLWIVGLLLAINLCVLVGLLLRPNTVESPLSAASREIAATPLPADGGSQSDFAEQVAAARRNPPAQQATLPASKVQKTVQEPIRSVLISQDPAAVPASSLYPTIQEVRAAGSTDIPDLHLDIHVFSPEPEDRFVFINMSKLREGSQLDEGPVVAEITPNGVVLHHDGQHFLLPRE